MCGGEGVWEGECAVWEKCLSSGSCGKWGGEGECV